jgi:hypothetical protein
MDKFEKSIREKEIKVARDSEENLFLTYHGGQGMQCVQEVRNDSILQSVLRLINNNELIKTDRRFYAFDVERELFYYEIKE